MSKKQKVSIASLIVFALGLCYFAFQNKESSQATAAASDAQYLDVDPDDILVDFQDDISQARVAEIGRQLGVRLELVSPESLDEKFYRAHVDPNRQRGLVNTLERMPEVELAEPDAYVTLIHGGSYTNQDSMWAPQEVTPPGPNHKGFPNDPLYKQQWHLDQIDMPSAWKLADGKGVVVAVLDTGVAFKNKGKKFHVAPDLDGVKFVKPFNFVDGNKDAMDDHGHGTHVAGTIGQVTNNGVGVAGVGRNVTIMPLKVLSGSGSGSVGGIVDAIRFAADNGAHVINMSLGGRFPSKAMEKAVAYAHKKGVTVICAAGNESSKKVGYPAGYRYAIAVSSTNHKEGKAFYSNYGKDIDIAAPGGDTRQKDRDGNPLGVLQNTIEIQNPAKSGYYAYMGTSMAAPHLAGVAALVVGEGVTDPAAVEAILKKTARKPKNNQYKKEHHGAGIVDAKQAVLSARKKDGPEKLFLGGLLLLALGGSLTMKEKVLAGATTLMSATGLFFLPSLFPSLSSTTGIEWLTRGLSSADMAILGISGHGSLIFFSALIPLAAVLLLLNLRGMTGILSGLCAGFAANLAYHGVVRSMDIQYFGDCGDALWLVANAVVCVALAFLVVRKGK